jgi:hypothetical protein
VELLQDGELLLVRQVAFRHQAGHVVAVAAVAWDPARGRVGMRDHALVFEHRHLVADGGAGKAQLVTLDERLRPHWLGGADEVIDDEGEDARAAV